MKLNDIDQTEINIKDWAGAEVFKGEARYYLGVFSSSGWSSKNLLLEYRTKSSADNDCESIWYEKER